MAGMTKAQLIAEHRRTIGIASDRIAQLERELAEASAERAQALSDLVVWETVTQPEGERLGAQLTGERDGWRAEADRLADALDEAQRVSKVHEDFCASYQRRYEKAVEARDALQAQMDAERRVATEAQAKLLKRAEDAEQAFTRVTHLTSENVQHWRARESALFDLVRHLASE